MYLLETITTLKAKRETETGMGEQEKHQDLTRDVYAHFGEPSYKCSTSCAPESGSARSPRPFF